MASTNPSHTTWVPIASTAKPFQQSIANGQVEGFVTEEYSHLASGFVANFERGEVGASFSVVADGQRVVDLWGGIARPDGTTPWQADTISVMYSCSKILAALTAHWLVEQGRIDLDVSLADIWPELRAAGQGASLRMVLAHTIGLPALSRRIRTGTYNDHAAVAKLLAEQEPLWPPGTRTGYHPLTFGFLLGEIVRRVDGRTLGNLFREEFAEPLGLDLHIGLPADEFARTATILDHVMQSGESLRHVGRKALDIGSIQNLWLFNSGGWKTEGLNTPEGLKPEVPAASGVGNARSLSALMAVFMDPQRLKAVGLSDVTTAALESVSSASHQDATLLCRSRFSLGCMKSMDNRNDPGADNFIIGESAFGHVGHGGSFAFCDREAGFAAAYVMNRKGPGILLNERGQSLIDSLYESHGYTGIRGGAWR